ncbi:MAG: adenosylhomocysteinase [Actinobacteria bacterium]|nr:adenosylhomocysteinase [Actinomycetota bacterium]MCL5069900.1 adenosylhomocysteinase [Actinomycetota bacterium]
MDYDVKDIGLAKEGANKIEWAGKDMLVLEGINNDFSRSKPFKGKAIGACLHVTSETANLMIALKSGGANVFLCASNPLSTQDDVAASLVKNHGISVFAIKGEDSKTYYKHINSVLDNNPQVSMDDGADLISTVHSSRKELIGNIIGGTEETTTGVVRLKIMEKKGVLQYPIIAVNEAKTKHFFDNRYGTGQSTIDGIMRATNILLSGKKFVVVGYGWCGKGVAMRARGMGASVIVLEVDPFKAIEAKMDGFDVMNAIEAAKIGDIFLSVTGNLNVIGENILKLCKDNAIVANSGHFDAEIDLNYLKKNCKSIKKVRPFVEQYEMKDGRRVNVLAEGRLVNLGAAEGHPASVMDMSFANQALSAKYIFENSKKKLEKKVYVVPEEIDKKIAELKLKSMGITIDKLTPEQEKYLNSWEMGT